MCVGVVLGEREKISQHHEHASLHHERSLSRTMVLTTAAGSVVMTYHVCEDTDDEEDGPRNDKHVDIVRAGMFVHTWNHK